MTSQTDSFSSPMVDIPGFHFSRAFFERPGGLRLHYVDEGQGATVLMVHGNPTWSFFWRRLISGLAPKYRCLAPDHMGMGLSSRPSKSDYSFRLADRVADLAALVEHVNPDGPVHLVVHDWGGPIGLGWAVEHPERVASITIMNTGTRIPPDYRLPLRLALFKRLAPLGSLLAVRGNLFAWGTSVFGVVKPLSEEARQGFLLPYQDASQRLAIGRFVEDIPLAPDHPSYDYLADIDRKAARLISEKPATLVWGLRDFVFNRTVYLDWSQRYPQASSLVLPEAGHYLMEDEPLRVTEHVRSFIDHWSNK
ncbi:alpha/beta hydrolase [Deltaproteobacteria bacterium Smac51]|nr:alpha/beta hydrolase [Deltaproteobacteria bacterium Smac51]